MVNCERYDQQNGFFDTPEGQEFTSSLGALKWPPERATFERKKGVYPELIDDDDKLYDFLQKLNNLPFDEGTTRISVRAFINEQSLRRSIGEGKLKEELCLEAIIPLGGCGVNALEKSCLVYFGKNLPQRKSPNYILEEQKQRVLKAFSLVNQQPANLSPLNDYGVRLLTFDERAKPEIFEMYFELYEPFGWDEKAVKSLLNSESNILISAFCKGRVVSSAMVEFGELIVTINGNQQIIFRLAEITEAATLPHYQGQGLYKAVSRRLLEFLASNDNPPHLVFGELNLDSQAVIVNALRQGRTTALETAKQFSFDDLNSGWFLEQHVPINSGRSFRQDGYPYNNLMPAWLTQKKLKELYS